MISTSFSQIAFPTSLYAQPSDLQQMSFSNLTENQRKLFILEKTFIHTNSILFPATCSYNKCCKMCITSVKGQLYCEVLEFLKIFSLCYCVFLFHILPAFVFHKYVWRSSMVISEHEDTNKNGNGISRFTSMDSFDKVNDKELQSSKSIHRTSSARDPKEVHLYSKSYLMSFTSSCLMHCAQSGANN